MTVRPDMLNGHATCHGGFTFTLADDAFAYACNACNRATVALGAQISFLAPAHQDEVLIATAREQSRTGRTGVYDVEVHQGGRDDRGAVPRPMSTRIKGHVCRTPEDDR